MGLQVADYEWLLTAKIVREVSLEIASEILSSLNVVETDATWHVIVWPQRTHSSSMHNFI